MTEPSDELPARWAVIEVMGHDSYAGRVYEETVAGAVLLRVDVPATERGQAYTKYFGANAIFSMSIVSEEIARRWAERNWKPPVSPYLLASSAEPRRLLPAPDDDPPDDRDYDDEDDDLYAGP